MKSRFLERREIGRRLLWSGLLELASPAHLGGADADATSDRPLLRDAEGRPYLPGSTLTGLLRGLLTEWDPRVATALFGADWGDRYGAQARLLLADAPIVHPEPGQGAPSRPVPTELRDGVAIDGATGLAAPNKKYDLELLPAGLRFRLQGQLDLRGEASRDDGLLDGLLYLLAALEDGRLAVGARGRRGFGATRLHTGPDGRWRVEDYRLDGPAGCYAWLGRDLEGLPDDWPRVAPADFPDTAALAGYLGRRLPTLVDTQRFTLSLGLTVSGSLLVGCDGRDPGQADRSQLQRPRWKANGEPVVETVLPGTSLAGVLRHRCRRIALTLGSAESAVDLVDWMFGPNRIDRRNSPWASRVSVREARIEDGQALRHTRVRIDPWTGGAVESLLFTEDAWYGGQVRVELSLREDKDDEDRTRAARALLLLALRDLASGELTVGAEGSVGRGRLAPVPGQPFAVTGTPAAQLFLEPDGGVRCEPAGVFDADFDALHERLSSGEVP